jgi:hypothetical protein
MKAAIPLISSFLRNVKLWTRHSSDILTCIMMVPLGFSKQPQLSPADSEERKTMSNSYPGSLVTILGLLPHAGKCNRVAEHQFT